MGVLKLLKIKIKLPATVIFSLAIWGCTSNNVEDIYPASPNCPTDNISYKGYIQPLFQANCYGCHDQQHGHDSASNNFLETYNDVAYHAKNLLLPCLQDANIKSPSHMPKNKPSLSDCDIRKVKAWIDQGIKDN